jgi:lysophospholipase L1-like esterase
MKKLLLFLILILSIPTQAQEYSYIDFSQTNTTTGNWNNVTASTLSQTGMTVNLINDQGANTGATLTVTDSFNLVNEAGTTSPNPSLPFPSSATRDSFFGNDVSFSGAIEPTGGFEITGLDPAKFYSFKVFASRTGVSDNREALYTVVGASTLTGTLNASNNTSDAVNIYNIHPDSTGKITFTAQKGPNNNNASGFYYLGAIKLISSTTSYSDGAVTSELTLVYPNGGETWHATAKPFITWNSQGLSGNVAIQYSVDNGTNWINLASVAASLKKYQWTIPYNVSSQCKVRVSSETLTDESENTFSIIENTDKRYKIVVLGSSTAAGAGPSSNTNAWVWLYTDYLKQQDTRFDITNLAVGGYTTFDILPTGTAIPGGVNETIDTARNITKAISLNADGIIVNMPSNDSNMGYSVAMQMDNYNLLNSTAQANNIPIWFCNVQPRNFAIGSSQMTTQLQMVTQIPTAFSTKTIDFWTTLANADGTVNSLYNSGDGIHLNDAGHQILLQRVINTGLHTIVKNGDDNDVNYIPTEKNYLVDFNLNSTLHPTSGNWNNVNGFAVSTPISLVDDLGYSSAIQVAITDNFSQSNELGAPQPSGTIIFPATALKDAVYGDNTNPIGVITLTGLNVDKIYSFEIFGSRKEVTDNRETQYIVTGSSSQSVTLNPSSNASLTSQIVDIAPTPNGTLTLTVAKGSNNDNSSGFYYLNALKLKERNVVIPDVLLDCEDGTTNKLAVLNVFSNGPGQSNADMVVVDNPNPSGINTSSKVVQFTRRTSGADAASWAGFYSNVVDPDPDFTENKYIHVKVLKQNPTGVRFKIENGAAGTVEKLSVNSYTQLGQWEDMVIDFSEKTGVYSTLGLQPDFESPLVAGADRIIYFDDIVLNNIPTPMTLSTESYQVKEAVYLYPNPVNTILNVSASSKLKSISVFTLEGRKVIDLNQIDTNFVSLDLASLNVGFYIIQIVDVNQKVSSSKIIKN